MLYYLPPSPVSRNPEGNRISFKKLFMLSVGNRFGTPRGWMVK